MPESQLAGLQKPGRPIRVMELRSTYRWGGGPDKTILNSAKLHDSEILSTLVVYLRGAWDEEFVLGDRARAMGLNVVEVVEKKALDLSSLGKLVRLVREQNIDIIHSRDYKCNLFALFIKKFFVKSVKIATTAHGWVGSGLKLKLYYTLDKLLVASFDRNFLLFKGQIADFIRKPRPERTVVIHNAIDPEDWRPDPTRMGSFRKEIGLPDEKLLIGFVGRIMPEKDILTMVKVADEVVNKRGIPAVFGLVGECRSDEYEQAIKAAVRQYGLEGAFLILGKRDNTKYAYQDFDIFLMTSIQEGFPNSLLEAMAMGIPSVVSAVDGIPEIMTNGENALICSAGDVPGFAEAIQKLVEDPGGAQKMAATARAMVENELSFDFRLRKMERAYVQLMNEV